MKRTLYTEDHEQFRSIVKEFVAREVSPKLEEWREAKIIGRETWKAAGEQGIVGVTGPEEYGGHGLDDFAYRMVVVEELAKVGATSLNSGFGVQDDILIPYVVRMGTDEQKQRWLPGMIAGEKIMAVAMTEPGTGSDLKGIRTNARATEGGWVLNGAKTFITSGYQADLVCVVAKTDPAGGTHAFSLLVVETGMEGFSRGRKLDKLGIIEQDTAELFFEDVFVPDANVLGEVGGGFRQLMHHLPQERLGIAMQAVGMAAAAVQWTIDYTNEREAFGQPIADFQNTRFVLADCLTQVEVGHTYVDAAIKAFNEGTLTAVDAAKAKLWTTEMQNSVVNRCLQLFGGYGFMNEYPIARAFADARVQTIYGGTSEVMREIIGRDIFGRR